MKGHGKMIYEYLSPSFSDALQARLHEELAIIDDSHGEGKVGWVPSMGVSSFDSKAGSAGMRLQEADIGNIALVIRLANFLSAFGLIMIAGVLTINHAIFQLWLCTVGEQKKQIAMEVRDRYVWYKLPGDFWDGCGTTGLEDSRPMEDCREDFENLPCMDIYLSKCVNEDQFWAGDLTVTVCEDSDYTDCFAACMLGFSDVWSSVVIASYTVIFGLVLAAYELSKALPSNIEKSVGCVRGWLEQYCGFIFLYKQRGCFLVFVGLLAAGNCHIEADLSEGQFIYFWYTFLTGIGVLANALFHFVVNCAKPAYDADMTNQLERAALTRADERAKRQQKQARGGGGGGDGGGGGGNAYVPPTMENADPSPDGSETATEARLRHGSSSSGGAERVPLRAGGAQMV
eukprot:COSAG01_NODE_12520_length_1726_cov_1.371850_2_plen_401_part_00